MTDNGSLVVRIWAGSGPGQYLVQAEGSSRDGQGQFQTELPRLENLAAKLVSNPEDIPDVAFGLAEELGSELFRAVFDGDIKSIYDEALGNASYRRGLRIVLRLDAAPELMDLPWEFLNDGTFVALKATIVRYLNVAQRCRPLRVSGKVRMLAVGSSGTSEYAALNIAGESVGIADAIRDVEKRGLAEVVWAKPTLTDLNEKLGQGEFNILHFFGHGDRDERTGESGLVFVTGDGQADLVKGRDLGTLLGRHESLQLVVLNACDAARTDRRDPSKGVASELVRARIPAVVAMQGAISDDAASKFANTFYRMLIGNGRPVDAALLSTRLELFAENRKRLEWATPVLFSRTQDDRIFEFPSEKFPRLESTPADQLAPVGADSAATSPGLALPPDAIRKLLSFASLLPDVAEIDGASGPARSQAAAPGYGPAGSAVGDDQPAPPANPAPANDVAQLLAKFDRLLAADHFQPTPAVPAPGSPAPAAGEDSPEAQEQSAPPPPGDSSARQAPSGPPRPSGPSGSPSGSPAPEPAGTPGSLDLSPPATTQPAVLQSPAPQLEAPSLAAVLGGTWIVQLRAPQYGMTTMTVTLIAFSAGQGQFEGNVWGAPVLVRGNWWSTGNQLQLQGARIIDGPLPQQYPYAVTLIFGSWNYQQLVGITAAGEQTFWTRQS